MRNNWITVFIVLLFSRCSFGDLVTEHEIEDVCGNRNITIDINTVRDYTNEPNESEETMVRSGNLSPEIEMREVECYESIIPPELSSHIWIGNILSKSSVINCSYKPLAYTKTPIKVSLTLQNTSPKIIVNPSYSSFLSYIQSQITRGYFTQTGEFSYTIEQFSSYNELKVAFGSNRNTSALFWGSTSTEEGEQHSINKATGLYVKFYQTSFKAIMDYPQGQIAQIPADIINSAVYVNSISFGRLGIMTLETNQTVEYSRRTINRIFHRFFIENSDNITQEERSFLNGCDFKVYLIGGNGKTGVETFTGYHGFIQHIKQGKFNHNEPGVPIFCTFNYVKDNSAVALKFRFNIKKGPLYVELVHKPKTVDGGAYRICGYGDLYLYFYRNGSKIPVVASPSVKVKVKCITKFLDRTDRVPKWEIDTTNRDFQNLGYGTSMLIFSNISTSEEKVPSMPQTPYGQKYQRFYNLRETDRGYIKRCEYLIEKSQDYVIVGENPISIENTKYGRNY